MKQGSNRIWWMLPKVARAKKKRLSKRVRTTFGRGDGKWFTLLTFFLGETAHVSYINQVIRVFTNQKHTQTKTTNSMKAHNMVIVHTHLIIFGRFTTYDPLGHGWVTHKPHPSQTFWTLPGLATSAWFPWRKRDFQGQHSLANSSCHSQPRYNPSKSLVDPILGNSLGVGCSRRRKTWESHGLGLFISFPKGLVVSVFPQFLSHDLQPLIASSRCNSWPEGSDQNAPMKASLYVLWEGK